MDEQGVREHGVQKRNAKDVFRRFLHESNAWIPEASPKLEVRAPEPIKCAQDEGLCDKPADSGGYIGLCSPVGFHAPAVGHQLRTFPDGIAFSGPRPKGLALLKGLEQQGAPRPRAGNDENGPINQLQRERGFRTARSGFASLRSKGRSVGAVRRRLRNGLHAGSTGSPDSGADEFVDPRNASERVSEDARAPCQVL